MSNFFKWFDENFFAFDPFRDSIRCEACHISSCLEHKKNVLKACISVIGKIVTCLVYEYKNLVF